MTNRVALVELFGATTRPGHHWKNDTNWMSDARYRLWYGISVDQGGNVQVVDLTNNELEGVLPDKDTFCGSLMNLQCLYLSSNQIYGCLPSNIGSLVSLVEINLAWNKLEGVVYLASLCL